MNIKKSNIKGAQVEAEILPPFHDVDMMGVVWHGHYYKYFEIARTKLLKQGKADFVDLSGLGYYFPVIDSHCKYRVPIRYDSKIKIVATVVEWEYNLKINYEICRGSDNVRLANGHVTHAVVKKNNDDYTACVPVPDEIAHLFTQESD